MKTIHQVFERQVEKTPKARAIIDGTASLTYQQLNERSNQLAHYLRESGIQPDMKIALCFERSLEMFIALMGILKAGAAYVPLDSSYPEDRLLFCLNDNNNPILILPSALKEKFKAYTGRCLFLDTEHDLISVQQNINPTNNTLPHHLAYVIYTSGSTGTPKGVLIEHHSVINYCYWLEDYCRLGSRETRIDFSANFIFDMAITTTLIPLLLGFTIVIANNRIKKTASSYLQHLVNQRINLIKITPSYFKLLLHELKNCPLSLPDLHNIILGGENLTRLECLEWLDLYPQHRLFNEYGPTEITVAVSQFMVNKKNIARLGMNIPIGTPGPNMSCYILDENKQPLDNGSSGELYIGGIGLARGYLNQSRLTEEKFVRLPFHEGRLYKTGDLCKKLADGNLEYLGRIDSQIKIRGFRVEIQEVEKCLRSHPAIDDAHIVVENPGQEPRLLAYFILKDPAQKLQNNELRHYLLTQLPEYMVPVFFIKLLYFPLTPNGKIDSKSLPQLPSESEKPYKAPETALEKAVAALWARELQLNSIGLQDNFFELGGHSLAAARIISDIQHILGKKLRLNAFYETNTLAELVGMIQDAEKMTPNNLTQTEIFKPNKPLPLGDFQMTLWMARAFEPKASQLNIVLRKRVHGFIDSKQLSRAFSAIFEKHEIFFYKILKFRPAQRVQKNLAFKFSENDFRFLLEKDSEIYLQNSLQELINFEDWRADRPLLKARLFYLANDKIELQLCMPHIISDDLSPEILLDELSTMYLHPQHFKRPDDNFQKYILREKEEAKTHFDQHTQFWKNYLSEATLFAMPLTAVVRDMAAEGLPYSTYFKLPLKVLSQLQSYCAHHHFSLNQGLCAVLTLAIHRCVRYSAENQSIVINQVKSTRDNTCYDNSIGCFLRVEPLKINLDRQTSLLKLCQQFRHAELETSAQQKCSNLIKLSCIKTLRQSSKIKNFLLSGLIDLGTFFFPNRKQKKSFLKLHQPLLSFKRDHHFLINVNVQNNFIVKDLPINKTVFGLETEDIPLYKYDLLTINSVLDTCFFHSNGEYYMVISANLLPNFRHEIGMAMNAILENETEIAEKVIA